MKVDGFSMIFPDFNLISGGFLRCQSRQPAVHLFFRVYVFPTFFFSQEISSGEAGVLIFMKRLLGLLPCHSGIRPFWRGEGVDF